MTDLEKRVAILELKEKIRSLSTKYGLALSCGAIQESDKIMCESLKMESDLRDLEKEAPKA